MPRMTCSAVTVQQTVDGTPGGSLTDAELKVINLIAQGVTNRAVATQLHLSPHTVKPTSAIRSPSWASTHAPN
jgi:DNA-binding NarL/FixJ family response regulator